MKKIISSIFLFICTISSFAAYSQQVKRQDWQWRTSISTTDNKGSAYTLTPFLWIPPACQKITAVLVASTAVLEQTMVEDPDVRAVCAKHGFAILWSSDNFYHDDVTATGQIQSMLQAFSTLTGYTELKTVPWILTGHSGTNPMPRYIITNTPDNIAFAIIHKAAAYCGNGTTVPVLSTQGEFMEWDSYSRDLTANISTEGTYGYTRGQRSTYDQPLSYFFDPNTGHFDCSKPLLRNIAMWMDDIADLRFDAQGNTIALDRTKGWIAGLPCAGYLTDAFQPITYTNQATTNLTLTQVKSAAWFPSQRTAQAAYDMANVSMTRTAQVTGFVDANGQYDDQSYWWRAIMLKIPYALNADGHSVTLNTAPYYRMPNRTDYFDNGFNPTQTFLNKADNSFTNSGNPAQIEVQSGNWIQTGAKTFEYVPRFKSTNYFVVRQPGNATYRSSVQAGNVNLPTLSTGADNVITFPAIANVNVTNSTPINLGASSSAGVVVRYFVSIGPAHIANGQLVIDKDSIPVRARFPLPVTVTAYHAGTVSPAVKTATAVSRTFYITNGTGTAITWFVSPTGSGSGASWDDCCSLSSALSNVAYGDNIFLKSGDYSLSASVSVDSKIVNIYGGFAGDESEANERVREDLDKNGIVEQWEFKNPTRLIGGRNKTTPLSFTVLKVTGGTASDVKIDGITIEDGLYLGNGSTAGVNIAGKCMLKNSIVRNCRVYNATGETNANAPGGVCITVADAVVDGCLIENCEAQASQINGTRAGQCRGGGAYISGGVLQNSIVRNNRVIYNMNRAPENTYTVYYNPYLFGAGIYSTLRTSKVINCVIANNEARVLNWNTANPASTVVIRGGGMANENGGQIINNTIVNNRAVVLDQAGNVLTTATSAGQGAGLYVQNGSSSTSYDNYVINNVFWGNAAPGTSSTYQNVRLTVNTTNVTPQPLVQYSNNITPQAISISATTAPFYAETNKYIDIASTNDGAGNTPLFKSPATFTGAVWGTTPASADSLNSIKTSNWSILPNSYLLNKGTTLYAAPTTDISGISRNASSPTVGAYEGLNFSTNNPALKKKDKAYRIKNQLFNLEIGDKVTVFDISGRRLESFTATKNTEEFQSMGNVIILIQCQSGDLYTLK